MNEIALVPDGALLVHNGIIEECGPSARIENLREARAAREIDAQGKIVIPAFIDPDAVLVTPPPPRNPSQSDAAPKPEIALRVLSRQILETGARAGAAAYARLGVLSLGAHTGFASDLRETTKVLGIHQSLQNKPLRIRSVFSPRVGPEAAEMMAKWLPAIRRRKLASILELTAPPSRGLREIAVAASSAGFSLRIRSAVPLEEDAYQLAFDAGVVAVIAPPPEDGAWPGRLASVGCVQVLSAGEALRNQNGRGGIARPLLEQDAALALASGYTTRGAASFNPQFLLYLAVARFGMTAEEALCAATWNAACSLRMSHVTGSLEPGKAADLLIVDVHDYRELARRAGHNDVQLALRAGRIVYRRAGLNLD
jgi:imidazolonepropionase